MKYESLEHAAAHHQAYPPLDQDLADHDFQRRRVGACAKFVRAGDVVLDVACNSGYYRDYIPQAAEVHGVDVSEALVAIAAQRLTSARVALAEALPFPDRFFDVVNVSGLLEQVVEPAPILAEAARVSRRFLTGNTVHESGTWGRHRIPAHKWQSRSYSEAEIRALLEPLGTIVELGTVDHGVEPQCWYWCLSVEVAT